MKKTISRFVRLAIAAAIATFSAASFAYGAPQNMITAGVTSQPIGHHQFCRSHGDECGQTARGSTPPAELTRERWTAMLEVNVGVNRQIQPMTDMEIHGRDEVWSYPDAVGDCEDYVLLKRRELMARGFPPSDLLITVVLQPDGMGHAVLTVRTDHGDFILDNMRDRILLWSDTEYTYLKRQSIENAGRWTTISDNRSPMAVGSVR